ncbi:Gamma-tubulin complex subunit mod21 [Schizosaccharomyces pombe]
MSRADQILQHLLRELIHNDSLVASEWLKHSKKIIQNVPSSTLVFHEMIEHVKGICDKMGIQGREDLEMPLRNACEVLNRQTVSVKQSILHAQILKLFLELSKPPSDIHVPQIPVYKDCNKNEQEAIIQLLTSCEGDHWLMPDWSSMPDDETITEDSEEETFNGNANEITIPANIHIPIIEESDNASNNKLCTLFKKSKQPNLDFLQIKPFMFWDSSLNETVRISERSIIRDSIYMLIGYPSFFFLKNGSKIETRLSLLPKLHHMSEEILRSIMTELADYGSNLEFFRQKLTSPSDSFFKSDDQSTKNEPFLSVVFIYPQIKPHLLSCLKNTHQELIKLETEVYNATKNCTLFQFFQHVKKFVDPLLCFRFAYEKSATNMWDFVKTLEFIYSTRNYSSQMFKLYKASAIAMLLWMVNQASQITSSMTIARPLYNILILCKDFPNNFLEKGNIALQLGSIVFDQSPTLNNLLVEMEILIRSKILKLGKSLDLFFDFQSLMGEFENLIKQQEEAKKSLWSKRFSRFYYGHYVFVNTCHNFFLTLYQSFTEVDENSIFNGVFETLNNDVDDESVIGEKEKLILKQKQKCLSEFFVDDIKKLLNEELLNCQKQELPDVMENTYQISTVSGIKNDPLFTLDQTCNIIAKLADNLIHPSVPIGSSAYRCRRNLADLLFLIMP